MWRSSERAPWSVLIVVSGLGICGCQADLYELVTVTGEVTCNGKPAVGGYVVFEPLDAPEKTGRPKGEPGGTSRGIVKEDGTFTLVMDAKGSSSERPGALTGPHRVSFMPPRTEPVEWNPSDDWLPEESKAKLREQLASIPVFEPLECGSTISPGEVEVVAGEDNHFKFTLSGTPPQPAPRGPQAQFGSD